MGMNVRTLCLGILHFGDATGYEIKKKVEQGMFSHFIEASYGSIYPALTAMTEAGLLTCRAEAQEGKPDRKVYSITPAGREVLVDSLRVKPGADKFKSQFLFLMLHADLLPPSHVGCAVDDRLRELNRELAEIRSAVCTCDHPGSEFVAGYGMAIMEAAIAYLEKNRDRWPAERPGTQDAPGLGAAAE